MHQKAAQVTDEKLDKFKILGLLGRGAMASVYHAFDKEDQREIALKVPDPRYADNPEFAARFNQEARAMARLNHPNIVRIYGIAEHDGLPSLAMEYIEGATLSKILTDRGRIEIDEALECILQICDGMECAHNAGVIHRDLKPGNILVESSGRVVIADFGISKLMSDEAHDDTLTFVGTPTYMSPEQCGEGQLDQRTDIYSLGIIFYEMILGHPPFDGATPAEIIKGHLLETPGFPSNKRDELPPNIVKIIRKMLAKSPSQRYTSVSALRRDMEVWKKWAETKSTGEIQSTIVNETAPLVLALVPQKMLLGAVVAALKNVEHQMIVADSSTDLLKKLSKMPTKMVILSQEHGKNGIFNVAEKLREIEGGSEIKVLLLSHGISRKDVETAFLSGIDDVIAEPFDPSVLIAKLESSLIGAQRSIESRRFFRKEMSDPIMVRVQNHILDISEGGMRIATSMVLKIGEVLKFDMPLFRELGLGEKSGRIVWVSKNHDGGPFTFQVGVDFLDLERGERDRLRKWIFTSEVNEHQAAPKPASTERPPDMGPILGASVNSVSLRVAL
jgi:serine/threonine protein kinase